MRKKTIEELRAGNAARQARWRAKYKWLAEQRRLALYGKSNADKKAGIGHKATAEEEERWEQESYYEPIELSEGDRGTVLANAREVARRTGRPVPGGLMEPEQEGGHGIHKNVGQTFERGVGAASVSGQTEQTAEERRVKAWIAKRQADQQRPGVKVRLDL